MKKTVMLLLGGVLFLASSCNKDEPKSIEEVQIEKPIEKSYIVTFHSQGGSEVPSKTVVFNETIREPNEPNMGNATSATFDGWYKNKSYNGTQFDFSTKITENMTLYAKWSVDAGASAVDNVTYGTIKLGNGQVWMDRNLGATEVASWVNHGFGDESLNIAVCGNYYQWGRGNDGHEKYNSNLSSKLINWNNLSSDKFIQDSFTWMIENTTIGQNYNNMNNPCPAGFRVPTRADFKKLKTYIGGYSTNIQTLFNALKMVRCGYRFFSGIYSYFNVGGYYWSSDRFNPIIGYAFSFYSDHVSLGLKSQTSQGYPVRCIKE